MAEPERRVCQHCGGEFVAALTYDGRRFTEGNRERIYCSDSCKVMAWRKKQAKGAKN
jgi:hypothetical protein